MVLRCLASSLVAGTLLLAPSLVHAQCRMDTECKGDRVCEGGKCVVPAAPPATPPAAAPAATPPAAATPPPAPRPPEPKMQRHSKGMMAGGIVMVSLTPVALVVAGFSSLLEELCEIDNDHPSSCDNGVVTYGALLVAAGLVGGGIPLIVIGAKKEPVPAAGATAVIAPWATHNAAGLGIRVDL